MCFRSVLGEDELRNLQLSWVPYSGWEGTGRSKEFSSKTCFFSVWTFSWWPWWSHFFIQMFKLIRRRKKRMKERRKKWLKRSRPRSEHQKHKKLNEYILTWQPNYNWKRIYGEKSLDDFFSWNIHFFLLIIDIVLSYILCDCAPQSIRGWRHGMLLIKSILSVIVFLQLKIKHKFMSWIEYWDDPL